MLKRQVCRGGLAFQRCIHIWRISEIRVWTLEGDVIHILSGHTSFVYSLALLPNGDIVSSGEDRSVRVWKGEGISNALPLS